MAELARLAISPVVSLLLLTLDELGGRHVGGLAQKLLLICQVGCQIKEPPACEPSG